MLTLNAVPVGQQVRMLGYLHQSSRCRHKLLAMGLTPGVILNVMSVAPLGDPIQIHLRGYTLSLRKKECEEIQVEYIHG